MEMKKYRVNDIFYSLQGEGRNTGRAAVFVRFSGCNLKCPFCDTDFSTYDEMTAEEIVAATKKLVPEHDSQSVLCVLTGGEPTLQVDEPLIDALHEAYDEVAMESNGTNEPPRNLDWLTVSPKEKVIVRKCNELKCIFDEQTVVDDLGIDADYYYLQPCDTGDAERNAQIMARCIAYIEQHPQWRLSLQTHKIINIQ